MPIAASMLAGLTALGLVSGQWLRPLDLTILDAQFRALRAFAVRPVQNEVVVVGFDEETTKALPEPLALWHPHLAKFMEAAASGGATAIGLDVVLPDRSYEKIVPGYDGQLLKGLLIARRTAPVVLAMTVDRAGATRPVYPAFVTAAGPGSTGFALLPVDADGTVRRFDERMGAHDGTVSTLVGQMARRLGRPVVPRGLIDFTAGPPFGFVPLETVLQWQQTGDSDQLERTFAGKAVLLGSVLRFEDRVKAPIDLAGWDPHAVTSPGVLLQAQALRNLLNNGLIQPIAPWVPVGLALAAALLGLWAPRPAAAVLLLSTAWAVSIALSTLALAKGLELPAGNAIVVALVSVGGRQAVESALRLRKRRRLRRAFGGYVSPAVLREILKGALDPGLGGTRRFGCVLFADIRDYTRRSEQMGPEQTIAFLNGYYSRIVPIIHAHGGTVISFLGDGIMVVFGVPQPVGNPCAAAMDTARAMLEYVRALNDELAQKREPPLEIGVGLHAGEGVAGHVGSSRRHEYTLIGDVTNVASRLQGVTKEVGYHLVCSRAVAERLPHPEDLVPLGLHAVKGHSDVEIFGHDATASATGKPLPSAHSLARVASELRCDGT